VANALIAAGVGSQSRVGFIGKNIAEYFTLVFGAAKINAVTVAVNSAAGGGRDGLHPEPRRDGGRCR